jgi:hypothetical protein
VRAALERRAIGRALFDKGDDDCRHIKRVAIEMHGRSGEVRKFKADGYYAGAESAANGVF